MENPSSNSVHPFHHKKNSHRQLSVSDTESQLSHMDSFHSPLRSDSPLRFDDPFPDHNPSKAIVAVEKYYSTLPSPVKPSPDNLSLPPPPPPPSSVFFNRVAREDAVTRVGHTRGGGADVEDGGAAAASMSGRSRKGVTASRLGLGFRVLEVVFCLISFSVMVTDKTEGWSGDSYDRYKEYRFCVAVNVIGFVYSGFQALDLAYNLATQMHFLPHHLQYHFGFLMDQILAYLLMSASSSAATKVVDWISNWGNDEFTEKASASIGLSFLAFIAFAVSSLISGYSLCNRDSS